MPFLEPNNFECDKTSTHVQSGSAPSFKRRSPSLVELVSAGADFWSLDHNWIPLRRSHPFGDRCGRTRPVSKAYVTSSWHWNLDLVDPAVLWLGKRFPLERSLWKRSLPLHLLSFLRSCAFTLWALLFVLQSGPLVHHDYSFLLQWS